MCCRSEPSTTTLLVQPSRGHVGYRKGDATMQENTNSFVRIYFKMVKFRSLSLKGSLPQVPEIVVLCELELVQVLL